AGGVVLPRRLLGGSPPRDALLRQQVREAGGEASEGGHPSGVGVGRDQGLCAPTQGRGDLLQVLAVVDHFDRALLGGLLRARRGRQLLEQPAQLSGVLRGGAGQQQGALGRDQLDQVRRGQGPYRRGGLQHRSGIGV